METMNNVIHNQNILYETVENGRETLSIFKYIHKKARIKYICIVARVLNSETIHKIIIGKLLLYSTFLLPLSVT